MTSSGFAAKQGRAARGMIALDFLFALVLIMGLTSILFSLALTLTAASITQYITYASARQYYAAHLTTTTQTQLALAKYNSLLQNPALSGLYRIGWFEVGRNPLPGDMTQEDLVGMGYEQQGQNKLTRFIGIATPFTAKILDRSIPFLGETYSEDLGASARERFKIYIGSYLGRSPSLYECQTFMRHDERFQAILDLSSGAGKYGDFINNVGYHLISDNGC